MTVVRSAALLGFGNVAAYGHVPGWRGRADVRLAAVAEPSPGQRDLAQRLLGDVHVYESAVDLLRHERVDFVDIAAPPASHVPLITAAAEAGAHVLCEKPLATAVTAYRAARAAVRRHRVVLHTVHNWKYSEAFGAVRRCLDTGAIGALRRIVFETERDGCSAMVGENWRMRAATAGGGIMVDHGWHALYLVLALADAVPRRVRATMERRRYTEIDVEDTAHCGIDFDGVTAEINLTWAARARRTCWRFEGEAGELIVDDDRLVVRRGGTERSEPLAQGLSAGSHHPEWFSGVVDAFVRELDDPTVRGTNQVEAEWCLLLLHLAYASHARGGQAIDVPHLAAWLDDGAVAA